MFSDFVGRSFVEDYGLAPERVVRVGCGPNLDVARIPPRRPPAQGGRAPTILFVGRDWENKGGPVVLDAFRRVRARLPDARLIVIGPPTIPVGPEPGLEFWGFLRKDVDADLARLLDAYAQADVFCLPTRYESFGIVLLEAMWFGLPVVAPGRWAIPEMVQDGVTGCLVPDERVEAYAEHLHALLADRDRAARMGEAGAARARERFSWDAVTAAMLRTIGRYVGR
jgi:glycosyltransferase involved in cell wall biosynthesis